MEFPTNVLVTPYKKSKELPYYGCGLATITKELHMYKEDNELQQLEKMTMKHQLLSCKGNTHLTQTPS
jgi:hypothetical protein